MNRVYRLVYVNIELMYFQGYYRNVSWIVGITPNEADEIGLKGNTMLKSIQKYCNLNQTYR